MSTAPKPKITVAEYLVRERQAERKSEYLAGEVFARAGASREHNRVKENLVVELGGRLKGGPCRTLSSDQRVLVEATGLFCYPDVVLLCGPGDYAAADRDTLIDPTALFEVLSPSTERYDRGAKFRHYQRIPTLQEYVLIAQDEPVCERFVRQADGSWALVSFVGMDAVLELTSVRVRIPLVDLFAGVEFPEEPPR